ncbi:hypothetical protein [Mesobacillus foraminis]|uniref:hypothetical protein n=1 Tax=Mesobacillus foraminis TaxID=279826 RepID=UPI000EF4BC95|nr:hypothetical protein [Mesobacillus foraminis]
MKKWAVAAIIYLAAVIGAYQIFDQFNASDKEISATGENEYKSGQHSDSHESNEGNNQSHSHKANTEHVHSEVIPSLSYTDGKIEIELRDLDGNPVSKLKVNHEKLLHLIVVNEELDQYYHLHPEELGGGQFQIDKDLPEGSFKAFVDIKPEELAYQVSPISFQSGDEASHHEHQKPLKPDRVLEKTVDGQKAMLKMSPFHPGEPVTITFDLGDGKLEPYLGAAGHVVILDETAENYLHVHPLNHNQPVFETTFNQAGIYKVWAEFKQGGKVRTFPFVVEIQ